jgi:hypothetical protein
MNDVQAMPRKVGKLSGKLVELGQFGQRGTELQYTFIKVSGEEGDAITLQRVAIPAELNRMLELLLRAQDRREVGRILQRLSLILYF